MNTSNPARIKILIVEDDPFINMIIKKILSTDYDIEIATSVLTAFAYLQTGNIPDLIISDLNMPDLSGMDFLMQLQTSSFYKCLPVIILSGENNTETRIKCLDNGADGYIVKPFNPTELLARIRALLRTMKKARGLL
jgi:DNA-binding response OmpR family regulator